MSETTTDPQGGASTEAEPAATETEAPAPAETGAETEQQPEPERQSRADRRFAALSARLAAGEQERTRLAAELDTYRRQMAPEPDKPIGPEDIPRIVEERVAAELANRQAKERVEAFHETGRKAFPDWQDRCQSLIAMGADQQFAELLVETPDGAKVAAALADDPEAMEKIAALKTERGRALALGRFAAALEHNPPEPAPARNVSRAPPPIRPLAAGPTRVNVDPTQLSTQQLVDIYSKEAMRARGL